MLCDDLLCAFSVDGCEVVDGIKPYILMHWWYVDIFTYFSHHFISIPPVGWISQAHDHGVLVLGSSILEFLYHPFKLLPTSTSDLNFVLNICCTPLYC